MRNHLMGMVALLAVASVCRASVPTNETFDTLSNGDTFNPTPRRGWGADVTAIAVTTAKAQSGANSVNVNGGAISNHINQGAASGVVWTEFHLIPHLGGEPEIAATNTANHIHYYGTNGFLNVYTIAGWVSVATDIHGHALDPVDTNTFNRITIYENFNTSTSAVLVDGVVVIQDVAFPGSSVRYDTFDVRNHEDEPAYLDTYSVGSTVPASLDGNGNGVPDAQELNDRGYVARNFTVGNSGNESFSTLAAAAAVVRNGDKLSVTNVTGTLGGGAATFNANITITGEDFVNDGAVTIGAGSTVTVANVAMDVDDASTIDGTLLVATNASFNANGVTMGASGLVDANSGTWGVDTPYLQLTGTFAISGADWNNPTAASALNFADNFEQYAPNTKLSALGFRGWGAADANAQVQSLAGQQGSRSAAVYGLVSNRVNGVGATNVWTDLRIYAWPGPEPARADAASSAQFCFTTNGYVAVYNGTGWDELTTDAAGGPATKIVAGTWARVTVFTQYATTRAALFVNDQLLREQLSFPSGGAAKYSLFSVENESSATVAIDTLTISQLVPNDLPGDVDGDTRADVNEIQEYGTIGAVGFPASVFQFR